MTASPALAGILLNLLSDEKEACLAYAAEHRMGLEIRDVDWACVMAGGAGRAQAIARYRRLLPAIPGLVTLHSPDKELSPGDADPQTATTARAWVGVFLDFAEELGLRRVVSHTWCERPEGAPSWLEGWLERHASFWREMLAGRSIEVCLENSWGHGPELLAAEVEAVGLPNVGACLDVGHAHLQGKTPLPRWVEVLGPHLRHLHLHDNDGSSDQHWAVGDGTIEWPRFVAALRGQGLRPAATLEVEGVARAVASIAHLRRLGA